MDNTTARAVALGLSLYFLRNIAYQPVVLFQTAERFLDYILYNQWPKEAAYGSEEEQEWTKSFLSPSSQTGQQAGEEEGFKEREVKQVDEKYRKPWEPSHVATDYGNV